MLSRLSFRGRVVLLMLTTMMVVSVIAGILIERVARQTVVTESEQTVQQLAAKSAAMINGQMLRVSAFPEALSTLAQTVDGPPESCLVLYNNAIPAMFTQAPDEVLSLTTFFEPNFIEGREYAKVWYVRDGDRQVMPVTTNMPGEPGYDPEQPLYNYFQQDWYTTPITSEQVAWSEPYFDAGGANVSMVTVSVPIRQSTQIIGVATADVKLGTIHALIDTIKPTLASYAILISRQGTIIAHPRRPDLAVSTSLAGAAARLQSPDLTQLAAVMRAGQPGLTYLRDPFTNTDVIAAYHPVSTTGWSLVVLVPIVDLIRPVILLRTTLLLIGVAALGTLALIGWFGATSLLRPVAHLVASVEQFASNRIAIRLGITRNDEIGRLAQAFEQMAAQIVRSYSMLETEVAARTSALQQALDDRDRQAQELVLALSEVQRKEQLIRDLGTPIVPLLDDVLLLPIVGVLDSDRASHLIEQLLRAVKMQQARIVYLDITGLALADTTVAAILLQAARMVRLLGAEIVLVGVRPEVAQTLVSLGLSLEGLRTLSNLQAAVLNTIQHPLRQR